eukprot:1695284-Rhodomonas_salina.1
MLSAATVCGTETAYDVRWRPMVCGTRIGDALVLGQGMGDSYLTVKALRNGDRGAVTCRLRP